MTRRELPPYLRFGRWQTGRSPRAATPSGPGFVFPIRARQPKRLPPFSASPIGRVQPGHALVGRTARVVGPYSRSSEAMTRAGFARAETGERLANHFGDVTRRSAPALCRLSRIGMPQDRPNEPPFPGEKMIELSG